MTECSLIAENPDLDPASLGEFDLLIRAQIREAFEKILQINNITDDDDFFDLGGDSILAVNLMVAISTVTGQELPTSAIFEAPTVRTIAALLTGTATVNQSAAIPLRSGAASESIFLIPGIGGSAIDLRELAQRIQTQHRVYALEARGLDGSGEPFDTVEDIALFNIELVKQIQPNGPYHLAGHSFGGLVALEMAHLLKLQGDGVASLAMFDTYAHVTFWPLGSRVAAWIRFARHFGSATLWRRLFAYHRSALHTKPLKEAIWYILTRARRAGFIATNIFLAGMFLKRFIDLPEASHDQRILPETLPTAVRRVKASSVTAFEAYRPRLYDGPVTFFKATMDDQTPFDPCRLWRPFIPSMTVIQIPCDHQNIIRAAVSELAAKFSSVVAEASRLQTGERRPIRPRDADALHVTPR